MSNIFTTAVRVYAHPGRGIDEIEAQWITWQLLGPRGSYCVPVWIRCQPDGRYVDIQYGSGKSGAIADFCDDHIGSDYETIWGRTVDDGHGLDIIWHHSYKSRQHTFCRYGFDEVRVQAPGDEPPVAPDAPWRRQADGSWRLAVAGSYRTGNDRFSDGPDPGRGIVTEPIHPLATELATPTTPNWHGMPLVSIDPPWLAPLTDLNPGATLIEYYWQGRVVHLVRKYERLRLEDRCADDWDNCLHPVFLIEVGATHLLAPEEVYERDRRDWDAFLSSFRQR